MEAYVSDCTGVIVLVARVPVRPTVSIALLSEGRGVPRLGPLAGLLAGVGGRITGRGITGGGRTGVGVGRTGGSDLDPLQAFSCCQRRCSREGKPHTYLTHDTLLPA